MTGLDQISGESVVLEPILDLKAADRLKSILMERRGRPLEIDASNVQRLGGLCLQVLISAQHAWMLEGIPMTIASRSGEFSETLKLFGADALFPTE
jgi:chemotaxis protein CheX